MPTTADIIAALKRRWRLELAIFVGIMLLVAIWTVLTPKTYMATASLLFDDSSGDPVQDNARVGDSAAQLGTQADVIKSESLAADVSRSLQLTPPVIVEMWRNQTGGNGDVNIWRGRQLLQGLSISTERASSVLSINFKSADPEFAAVIANGFASAYLDARLKQKTDPARTYSRFFEDRTREVRGKLEQAQAKLTEFQRRTGIVDTGQADAEINTLNELLGQVAGAEGLSADAKSKTGGSASQLPDVQASGVVQQLRSDIAAKSAQISQIRTLLGPNHPDRIAAEAELAALRGKLAGEVGATTNSIRLASSAANAKEADLRNRLESQRKRMLALAADRAQLDVLQHDVASARASYDAVTMKLGTMRLQSEAPTNNARQLDFATAPLLPSTPNVPLRFVLGAILGALLAAAASAALEFLRPRVRTSSGLAASGGRPVIARIELSQSRIAPLLVARAAQ